MSEFEPPTLSYDSAGTPGVWARDIAQAYFGMGWLHARHRPLQAHILRLAARGQLAEKLAPRADLVAFDALMHRLDLPRRAAAEEKRLDPVTATRLDAFLQGFAHGLRVDGPPFELRLLGCPVPPLQRTDVLAALMVSAYLGLAEGQERMERALLQCLSAGADVQLLQHMFAPHLQGMDVDLLRRVGQLGHCMPYGSTMHSLRQGGGSNAWAVSGARSESGYPMLCGDPHLQINQLPSLLFEVRLRVGDDYWLGASIPGLPGIAVGRNRHVAWSGTFAVADNVDFTVETLSAGHARRRMGDAEAVTVRSACVQQRFRAPRPLTFFDTSHGTLERDSCADGLALAVRWAGSADTAAALGAYMELPTAGSAVDAARILRRAHTLSLHFVLADRSGALRYRQAGRIPKRTAHWSGLYPVAAGAPARWDGFYVGELLPEGDAEDGIIVSANEARPAPDGGVLATLAQPDYRRARIDALLRARPLHDVASMQAIQLDLISRQGQRLAPSLTAALAPGPLREALSTWDFACHTDSIGAHAFAIAYRAALQGLAPELGGDVYAQLLAQTELSVWWCAALDKILALPQSWQGARGARLTASLHKVSQQAPHAWGSVQQVRFAHMILGDLPNVLGFSQGPYPLPGSIATVQQGNNVPGALGPVTVAPAYRMVCDLGDDAIYTTVPGGIDGSRFTKTYSCWLNDWRAGIYHRLAPPERHELALQPTTTTALS